MPPGMVGKVMRLGVCGSRSIAYRMTLQTLGADVAEAVVVEVTNDHSYDMDLAMWLLTESCVEMRELGKAPENRIQ